MALMTTTFLLTSTSTSSGASTMTATDVYARVAVRRGSHGHSATYPTPLLVINPEEARSSADPDAVGRRRKDAPVRTPGSRHARAFDEARSVGGLRFGSGASMEV